jgi:hypothetical protein
VGFSSSSSISGLKDRLKPSCNMADTLGYAVQGRQMQQRTSVRQPNVLQVSSAPYQCQIATVHPSKTGHHQSSRQHTRIPIQFWGWQDAEGNAGAYIQT